MRLENGAPPGKVSREASGGEARMRRRIIPAIREVNFVRTLFTSPFINQAEKRNFGHDRNIRVLLAYFAKTFICEKVWILKEMVGCTFKKRYKFYFIFHILL